MCVRELALPISACSAGSSQTLRLPTPATEAARRFCERRLTIRYDLWREMGQTKEDEADKLVSSLALILRIRTYPS